jgi:hypothetical protein
MVLSWCQSTQFFMIRAHFMFSSQCEAPKKIVNCLSCPSLLMVLNTWQLKFSICATFPVILIFLAIKTKTFSIICNTKTDVQCTKSKKYAAWCFPIRIPAPGMSFFFQFPSHRLHLIQINCCKLRCCSEELAFHYYHRATPKEKKWVKTSLVSALYLLFIRRCMSMGPN